MSMAIPMPPVMSAYPFRPVTQRAAAKADWSARLIAILALISMAGLLVSEIWVGQIWNRANLIIALVVLLALLSFWQFIPSETRVRQAGDIYAESLLDSLSSI